MTTKEAEKAYVKRVSRLRALKRKQAADFAEIYLEEAVHHYLFCGYGIPMSVLRKCDLHASVVVSDLGLSVQVNVHPQAEASNHAT